MGFLSDLDKVSILSNGNNFLNRGEYGFAKIQFNRYLDLYGYEEGVMERKALCHMNLREYREAISCYNTILSHGRNKFALNHKGHAYNELRQPASALNPLNECTKYYPDFAEGWTNKGRSLAALERYSESFECYTKALELEPHLYEAQVGLQFLIDKKNEYNNKAIKLDDEGRYSEAIKYYDKAIEITPNDAILYSNKGISLENKNDINEAMKTFESALEYDAYNDVARNRLSIIYNRKGNEAHNIGQYKKAVEFYDKSLEMDRDDPIVLCNKGGSLYHNNEKEEALKIFRIVLSIDSEYETALDYIQKLKDEGFDVEFHIENEEDEEESLEITEENQDYIEKLENLFILYEQGKITKNEYEIQKEELINDYDDTPPYVPSYSYGDYYDPSSAPPSDRQLAYAIEDCNETLMNDPNNLFDTRRKAQCLESLKKYKIAVKYYNRLLKLDSYDYINWYYKACCLEEWGKNEEALECINQALDLAPDDSYCWGLKARVLDNLGRYDESRRCAEKEVEYFGF